MPTRRDGARKRVPSFSLYQACPGVLVMHLATCGRGLWVPTNPGHTSGAQVALSPAATRWHAAGSFEGAGLARAAGVGGRHSQLFGQLPAAAGGTLRLLLPANKQLKPIATVATLVIEKRHPGALRKNEGLGWQTVTRALNYCRALKPIVEVGRPRPPACRG